MLYDYFNSCLYARSLGIMAQIKKLGRPLLVFRGLSFDIYVIIFWLTSEKYKIMSLKKESLRTSKISSFSFKLYFEFTGDSLCISTMYYSLL
jgi:hypothetical protein